MDPNICNLLQYKYTTFEHQRFLRLHSPNSPTHTCMDSSAPMSVILRASGIWRLTTSSSRADSVESQQLVQMPSELRVVAFKRFQVSGVQGSGLSGGWGFGLRTSGVPKGIHTRSLRHQGDPTIQLPAVPRGIFDRVDCVGRCSHVLKRRIQSFRKLRPHGFGRSSGASDSRVDGFRA